MEKLLVLMGSILILIGIAFVAFGFIESPMDLFWMGTAIWTVGSITLVLGLTIFTKEGHLNRQ